MRTADKFATVTIEWPDGTTDPAYFVDEVYPDRTANQWDHGIIVNVEGSGFCMGDAPFFISFTDAKIYQEGFSGALDDMIDGARCSEVCVMVAVRDAKETYNYDYDREGKLVIV